MLFLIFLKFYVAANRLFLPDNYLSMKKVFLVFAVAFGTYAAQAQTLAPAKADVAAAAPVQKAPADVTKMATFKNDDFDFGKIPFGKAAEYTLTIKNISKEAITLDDVKVGCGCTTPKFEKGKKIEPGQAYDVVLGFNGMTDGHFEKYATLMFNDGATKQVKFHGDTYKVPENAAPANENVQKVKPAN